MYVPNISGTPPGVQNTINDVATQMSLSPIFWRRVGADVHQLNYFIV